MRNWAQTNCRRCGHNVRHFPDGKCGVTDEMRDALKRYAEANGVRWKSKLSWGWMTNDPEACVPLLIQVRNVIGPSGLYKIRLPK
jgi:ribosomal protein L37E